MEAPGKVKTPERWGSMRAAIQSPPAWPRAEEDLGSKGDSSVVRRGPKGALQRAARAGRQPPTCANDPGRDSDVCSNRGPLMGAG